MRDNVVPIGSKAPAVVQVHKLPSLLQQLLSEVENHSNVVVLANKRQPLELDAVETLLSHKNLAFQSQCQQQLDDYFLMLANDVLIKKSSGC